MTYGDGIFEQYYKYAISPEYRRVEYLESSGTQWIDTNYVIADSSVAVTLSFALTSAYVFSNYSFIFGANEGSKLRFEVRAPSNTELRFSTEASGSYNLAVPPLDYTRHVLHYAYSSAALDGGALAILPYQYNNSATVPLRLFGRTAAGVGSYAVAGVRMYGFSMRHGGVAVRDFVPCVRIADNKAGFYDLCGSNCPLTGTPFYINSGTGADFNWGELTV